MKSMLPCPHIFLKVALLNEIILWCEILFDLVSQKSPQSFCIQTKKLSKNQYILLKITNLNKYKRKRIAKLYCQNVVLNFLEIQFHRIEAELRIMKMSNFSFDVITYPQKVYKYTIFCTLHSIFKSHNKTCTLQRYSMFINWIGIASKTYCFLSKHKNYKPSKSIFVSTKISQQYQLQESLAITIVSQKKKKTYSFKPYVQLLPQQY
eukprot:TRINITY_DN144_c0_g2_i4.p1 TRINITY_DN144_c0_g2~~TRINITY_DN144_c0_g2_i4.p1  ORF type:complete len:207 (+),score=-15.66 TRINITY_DN144_c0_g2_i4:349-969(+)